MKYWYLASPYSTYRGGHDAAFRHAAIETSRLMKTGLVVYSPIVHCHPLHVYGGMGGQTDFESWRRVDEVMMEGSSGLIVLMLPGWDESYGVKAEIEWFKQHDVEPIYMTPGVLPKIL